MKLVEKIGEPAVLELLAEECTELAHAALKLARIKRGENPTPTTEEEAISSLIEEMADVGICAAAVSVCDWYDNLKEMTVSIGKVERMVKRLDSKRGTTINRKDAQQAETDQ